MNGKLISFEGIDGSGTTTQVRESATRIRKEFGCEVLETFEPSSGPIGKVVRSWLRGEEERPSPRTLCASFILDRVHHCETVIVPALENGTHVFTDRYSLSTYAYQSLDVLREDIDCLNLFLGKDTVEPDLTFVLSLPVIFAIERLSGRNIREIYERRSILEIVSKNYEELPNELGLNYEIINASQPIEKVTDCIIEILTDFLPL